jgi:hypothetical protein
MQLRRSLGLAGNGQAIEAQKHNLPEEKNKLGEIHSLSA